MNKKISIYINKFISKFGYKIVKQSRFVEVPYDMDKGFEPIFRKCEKFTKTGPERMFSMYKGTQYIEDAHIPGSIVECGVWKGGSIMVSAFMLAQNQKFERNFYLYDTYAGMVAPTEKDVTVKHNVSVKSRWEKTDRGSYNEWTLAPLEEVQKNLFSTGYDKKMIHFIKGKVEDTIPAQLPGQIALLRLDTDWYESTKHELIHLFPLVAPGGVIIIDDYGVFQGARDAVDEYFQEKNVKILLNRVDHTGRVGVKRG